MDQSRQARASLRLRTFATSSTSSLLPSIPSDIWRKEIGKRTKSKKTTGLRKGSLEAPLPVLHLLFLLHLVPAPSLLLSCKALDFD